MTVHQSSIQLFQGDPISNTAEVACVRNLQRDLRDAERDAIILANLTVGPKRRQIDLIVATAETAIVVEVKGYVHPVHGEVDGPWALEMDDGSRRELSNTNPYRQALENRFAVTDRLRGADGPDLKPAIGGMLCVYPMPPSGSSIPAGDFKLAIGGYADLLSLLQQPRPNAVSLARWQAFAQSLGLKEQNTRSPTEAEHIVADYIAAFQDLSGATLGPYVEPLFDCEESTEGLATRCANGEQLQIVGASGSGKTELLKHLGAACASRGNLPILIRARDFDRDIGPLIRADTARYTHRSVPTLLKAAAEVGAQVILHVDALNECPSERRTDLIAALQAARINYGIMVVLSGQEYAALPASLCGTSVMLRQPDKVQAQRMVEAHIRRPMSTPEMDALEVVATAHDAAILAVMLGEANSADGRFALYHGFTQARLKAAGAAGADRGLANLATAMRTGFVAAMPKAAAERLVDPRSAVTIDAILGTGLLWSETNRVGFRHDLIGDFFAADALLRRADTPAELAGLARQPIHAELREFLLGGCATTQEIATLLSNAPDSRILESALSGRAGAKARDYIFDRMRDLIARLKQRYTKITLALPEDFATARQLTSLVPSLGEGNEDAPGDGLYLKLIGSAVKDGLLPDLLDLFAAVDWRLLAEAERLRAEHQDYQIAWRAAAFGTVYGMHHHHAGARHLQNLFQDIQNDWGRNDGEEGIAGLEDQLATFEELSIGQLFLLLSVLRRANNNPLPARFPELLRHVWMTKVYLLRLVICDIIRFRGGELDEADSDAVREALGEFMSNNNVFLNGILIDALEGVDGIETDFTVEDAVESYEAMLAQPETPETRSMALSGLTSTYDHPYRNIYWEAFYEALAVEKRQALLLRALREARSDPWFVSDVLRAMAREPNAAAEPELQEFALGPRVDGHSHQFAVISFVDAIRLLATLGLPLDPPSPPPADATVRAWYRSAPLLYVLNGGRLSSLPHGAVEEFVACGTAESFDVVQRLAREARSFGFYKNANMAFDALWPDMVLQLIRMALADGYVALSAFPHYATSQSLQDDHVDAALQMMARVGRTTDIALVQGWLEHPSHGEQALRTARAIEAQLIG